MDIKNKKIPSILLFLIITFYIYIDSSKTIIDNYMEAKLYLKSGLDIPLNLYDVNIFFTYFNYANLLIFNILLFGIGLYLFFYSSDLKIKNSINEFFRLFNNKLKKRKKNSPVTVARMKSVDINYKKLIYRIITAGALIWTFYISVKTGYYIFFYVVLSYFYYQELKTESTGAILWKAIFFPLGPFVFLVFFGASTSMNENPYEPSMGYHFMKELGKAIFPLIICSVVTFTTLKVKMNKLKNSGDFRISPIFSIITVIVIITSTVSLYAHNKIKNVDLSEYTTGKEDFDELIGLKLENSKVQKHFDNYAEEPVIDELEDEIVYSFTGSEISFVTSKEYEITDVYLYPGFKGELPGNLTFSDSKSEVITKLGAPNKFGTSSAIWSDQQIIIDFGENDLSIETLILY